MFILNAEVTRFGNIAAANSRGCCPSIAPFAKSRRIINGGGYGSKELLFCDRQKEMIPEIGEQVLSAGKDTDRKGAGLLRNLCARSRLLACPGFVCVQTLKKRATPAGGYSPIQVFLVLKQCKTARSILSNFL